MLYAELGRHPIDIEIKSRMIKYWNKLLLEKDSKLSHISYLAMKNESHEFKWIKHIKSILNTTGNSDIWLNQSRITSNSINKLIKQKLIYQFNKT